MAFMQLEMTGKVAWYEVDGPYGTEFVPEDACGPIDLSTAPELDAEGYRQLPIGLADYCENRRTYDRPDAVRRILGYGVRWSAPGYLDCTDWTVFARKADALAYAREQAAEEAEAEAKD